MHPTSNRLLLLAAFLLTHALAAASARADVIPIDVEACTGRAAGAACVAGGTTGACQASECTRLSYGDAATPTVVEYDCLRCVPGARTGGGCSATPGSAAAGGAGVLVAAFVAAFVGRRVRRGR